jgi:methylase of polypeptide subunit release factors
VSTLRESAALLSRAHSLRDLGAIATALGFGEAATLDAASRRAIGLDGGVRRAGVSTGSGALRALLIDASTERPLRETVARAAARVAAHSPQLLWVVVAVQSASHAIALAAPAPGAPPRVAAMLADVTRVLDSDAETLAAMIDASRAADLLVHVRWREILGRDALTRRFYRELERAVFDLAATARGEAPERARREIALLHASRLLFLAFLEAKGWLDGDREFVRHAFDARCAQGGHVHRRLLEPLFFGTLNTPIARRAPAARALGRIPFLNGGLFARTPIEKRHRALRLTDESLGELIGGLLARYRVTAREASVEWSEAAVDPEMLGRAFESLMASDDRRSSGAFYTPSEIITRVAGEGLEEALTGLGVDAGVVRAALAGHRPTWADGERLRGALRTIRVLDPACGSGAFLVHILERLAELGAAAGDERTVGERRREALTASIFGVDVNPTAVWLCELRLWLSVVIDADESDPLAVAPLPNLDRNIRVGDALSGASFDDAPPISAPATLAQLRGRYARSVGVRKRSLARALDREERGAALAVVARELERVSALRRDLLSAARARDLFAERRPPAPGRQQEIDRLRGRAREARRQAAALRQGAPLPFSFPAHFADVGARGGFDLVLGNPPWVRIHQIPPATRDALRERYRAFREAAWVSGAAETGAGRAFAGQVDLASLFVERAVSLARSGGVIALVLPVKLWRSLAGGGVRRVLTDDTELRSLEDWSGSHAAFDAVTYPSMLVALRRESPAIHDVSLGVQRRDRTLAWRAAREDLPLDDSPGAPWLLLPPEVRAGFDRLADGGVPLARSRFGRPLLGVKTGCNEAFTVEEGADIEPGLLRPLLKGEGVRAWRTERSTEMLLWTHDANDQPIARLPRAAAAMLAPWRRRLEARTDGRSRARWWGLFRTESARSDLPRVVWSDIGRAPRALVLEAGDATVPLNSCYAVRAPTLDDALTLAAVLNSAVAAAWLAAIAEPARGGYFRYLGWTMARLPLPGDWPRAVHLLAPIARAALDGSPPDPASLVEAVTRAYRVRPADIAPLLTWCLR